mmetsp:Transcript_17450/g.36232  ORF Transcript_17450/g.36232 Transcript_17450/m.36232 type:complete len:291 (-) Transcript_17450:312-1184(-)
MTEFSVLVLSLLGTALLASASHLEISPCTPFVPAVSLFALTDLNIGGTNVAFSSVACGKATISGGVTLSSQGRFDICINGATPSLFSRGALNASAASGTILGPGKLVFDRANPASIVSKSLTVACGIESSVGQVHCPEISSELLKLNRQFCRAPTTGSFSIANDVIGVLDGSSVASKTVFFSVSAADFQKVRTWQPVGLDGKAVVVNVRGRAVQFGSGSMGSLNQIKNALVWNFCGARTLEYNVGSFLVGGFLAPTAAYTGGNNAINGPLVVYSYSGSTAIVDAGPISIC